MLTLPQARLLLSTVLPLPHLTLERAIDIIHYYHQRHADARESHSRRTEAWIANMHEIVGPGYRIIDPPIRS
ncbi:MAG: hypothetical protein HC828_00710 [Blastochloris sp.]|nr:hypothetical protein [Blastochloris sp.]